MFFRLHVAGPSAWNALSQHVTSAIDHFQVYRKFARRPVCSDVAMPNVRHLFSARAMMQYFEHLIAHYYSLTYCSLSEVVNINVHATRLLRFYANNKKTLQYCTVNKM